MPGGLLTTVQVLNAEVVALKDRCYKLESSCDGLKGQVRELAVGREAAERAQEKLCAQVAELLAQLEMQGKIKKEKNSGGKKGVVFRERNSVLEIGGLAETKAEARSTRKRVPTSFAPNVKAEGGVQFSQDADEEESELAPGATMRPTRMRQATAMPSQAMVLEDEDDEDEDATDKHVDFEEDGSHDAEARSGRRMRVPTAFPSKPPDDEDEGDDDNDDDDDDEQEANGVGKKKVGFQGAAGLNGRAGRMRVPTAFPGKVSLDDEEDEEDVEDKKDDKQAAPKKKGISFRERTSVLEIAGNDKAAARSTRKRVPTAAVPSSGVELGGGVKFDDGADVEEQEAAPTAGLRPTRARQATAFIPPPRGGANAEDEDEDGDEEDAAKKKRIGFQDADGSEMPEDKAPTRSRMRVPTAYHKSSAGAAFERGVSFADGLTDCPTEESDEDSDDTDQSPTMRPARARIPTACVPHSKIPVDSDEEPDEDQEMAAQARPARVRLPTACPKDEGEEALNEDDLVKKKRPAVAEETTGPGGEAVVPPNIDEYLDSTSSRNDDLVVRTLKSLYFFRGVEEKGITTLVDAMELYTFPDGVDVTRQGNSHGTHFFVIAEGDFAVLKNGKEIATISCGSAFGESVVLLSGKQNATVRAKGTAKAYGMKGTAIRTLLKKQYQDERKEVIDAINDVLSSEKCALLQKLTPYQSQCLYDQAEAFQGARGECLWESGQPASELIHVLVHGTIMLKVEGRSPVRLNRFAVIGDSTQRLHEARAMVTAEEGPILTLTLTPALLADMFGAKLEERLLHNRVVEILSSKEAFSMLGVEQQAAVADLRQTFEIAPGEVLEKEKVRMVVCLSGTVDLEVTQVGKAPLPSQKLLGCTTDTYFSEGQLSRGNPWDLKARAGMSAAKVAIWEDKALDTVLKIGVLRRGESKLLEPSSPSGMKFTRSPSMKLAVCQDDKMGALRKVFVFKSLSGFQLSQLASRMKEKDVEAREHVFEQGQEAKEFYIIHSGQVQIEINGRKVRTLGMGDYVGERALLFSEPRSATVTAVEETVLWTMEAEDFHSVVRGPILDYMKDRIAFQSTKVTLETLNCVRIVGRGGFGVVKMVQAGGVRYALKCVSKKLAVEQKQQKALAIERSILAELDHPFIIKFVSSFQGPRFVYFLMELVTGGELLDALDVLGLLRRPQAQFYVASIALALEFLHERHIAYLDLKGENCLIDQHGYLKMVDFGIAERVKNGRIYAVKGTPLFMAPEVILGKGYTTTADLWGLGVCLYDFMMGRFPFGDDTAGKSEVFRAVLKAPLTFPKGFKDAPTKQLLEGLLSRDPSKRPGAGPDGYAELKGHAFFEGFSFDSLLARQLEAPYKPKGETYAEDQEEGKGAVPASEQNASVAEDDVGEDDDWSDPDPSWSQDF